MNMKHGRREEFQDHRDELKKRHRDVCSLIDDYNSEVDARVSKINEAVQDYNNYVMTFNDFVDDTAKELREDFEDEDQSWHESDEGIAADEAIDIWQGFVADEMDEFQTEELDQPNPDLYEDTDKLPLKFD